MAKLFKTSDDILELVNRKFQETQLNNYGLTLKTISVTKAKDVVKVSKASATTEFIAKRDGMIQLFIYETVFDRLPDRTKEMLVEMALSNVSYDSEKDKVNVESNPFRQLFAMRQKYGDSIMDDLELSYRIIDEVEEEEREKKREERENKKIKNNMQ